MFEFDDYDHLAHGIEEFMSKKGISHDDPINKLIDALQEEGYEE